MEQNQTFGDWLRQLRRARDLTQEALAERAGCATDTLRAIETGRRRPSRELAALLADRLSLAPEERARFLDLARGGRHAGAEPPTGHPRPAPADPPVLIGRSEDLARIAVRLAEPTCRLLTLVGPGGIGKTSLAAQLAHLLAPRFRDGVVTVALAGVTEPRAAVDAVARAAEVNLTSADRADPLVQRLRDGQLLLVLDNLEQLLTTDELLELLRALAREAPGVQVLATSRQPLSLRHEWVYELGGLDLPAPDGSGAPVHSDAVLLFLERARRRSARFVLTADNQADIVGICQVLDGVPLAIELAAAWVPVLSCAEIAQELRRSLELLDGGDRDLPERHRSMRAVFQGSWQLLSDAERQALARLSCFRSGFTRDAADEIAGARLPLLASLVRASLLQRSGDRYTMHELLRQYAAEQQGDIAGRQATEARFLRHYQALAEQAAADLLSNDQRGWIERLGAELDNLREALRLALARQDGAAGASLCAGLRAFWALRGSLREGVSWGERFLALPGVPDAARLRLLGALLPLLRMAGGWDRALDYAQEALALLDRADDLPVRATVQAVVGLAELDRGDHARARAHLADCLATTRLLGNRYLQAMTLCNLGHASLYDGDTATARECYLQASQLAQHERAELTVAQARYGLAAVATLADDPAGEELCRQALPVLHGFGFLLLIVQSLELLAAQAGLRGEHLRGRQIWGAAAHLRTQHQLAVAPGTRMVYRRLADRARGPIDEQGWEQAQAGEQALTLNQAVALALGAAQDGRPLPAANR